MAAPAPSPALTRSKGDRQTWVTICWPCAATALRRCVSPEPHTGALTPGTQGGGLTWNLRCRDPLCDVPTTRRGPSLRGSDSAQSRGGAEYLVLLPSLPLLLNLLLLLQLLRHAGFPQGLALAPLVRFGVEGRLQGRVPSHAGHHLLSHMGQGVWGVVGRGQREIHKSKQKDPRETLSNINIGFLLG